MNQSAVSVGGQGRVIKKAQAKPAQVHGFGEIIRKDGTRVPFELIGETHLSEAETRAILKTEE